MRYWNSPPLCGTSLVISYGPGAARRKCGPANCTVCPTVNLCIWITYQFDLNDAQLVSHFAARSFAPLRGQRKTKRKGSPAFCAVVRWRLRWGGFGGKHESNDRGLDRRPLRPASCLTNRTSITFGGSIILKSHHEGGSSRLGNKRRSALAVRTSGHYSTEGVTAAAPLLLHCKASVDEAAIMARSNRRTRMSNSSAIPCGMLASNVSASKSGASHRNAETKHQRLLA
jgi:hypothetical protein